MSIDPLPAPWLEALLALHAPAPEDDLPLDLSFELPSLELAQALLRAGLIAQVDGGLALTETGRQRLQAVCTARQKHSADLPWGSVTVIEGLFEGEAGYYDDDEALFHNVDPERLAGYNPGNRAVVYLFSRGEPFQSEPALIPHHHLRAEAHMAQESWVQANPVRAAICGVPSLSGIEHSISSEAKAALLAKVGDPLSPPSSTEE